MIPVAGLTTSGVIPLSSVTVRTFAASTIGTDYYGAYGTPTDVVELMPVHPAPQRDIQNLPEAFRDREAISLYAPATSALRRAAGTTPPIVTYQGRRYMVVARQDYDAAGGASIITASLIDEETAPP